MTLGTVAWVLDSHPLVDDPTVMAVPVEESGDELVSVEDYGLTAAAADAHREVEEHPTRLMVRRSVAQRLLIAQGRLPDGVELMVVEGHRPVEFQARIWERRFAAVRAAEPELDDDAVHDVVARYIAPPWIGPPHSTGGAVDVTLAFGNEEADLGGAVNEVGPLMSTAAEGLDAAQRARRTVLVGAMESAGFVNYPFEWWHYSYGDRYWAASVGATAACFAPIEWDL